MKKIYICIGLLMGCTSVYAVDDNSFCMLGGPKLYYTESPHTIMTTSNDANISFTMDSSNSYSITSGQTFDGVTNVTSGSMSGCIDIQADRSNSTTPVNWVESEEGNDSSWWNSNYMTLSTGGGSTPSDLNFAVEGTLQISVNGTTYSCPHTIIAQGHDSIDNNWWIFNNQEAYEEGWHHSLYCNNGGQSDQLVLEGNGSSDIEVSQINPVS